MSYRSRGEYRIYKKHTKKVNESGTCEFCKIKAGSKQYVEETAHFKIIKNIFPYSFWDYHKVADHLMIVPKKHTDTLDDISDAEASEYIRLLGSYEVRGYDVFARSPTSFSKSVPHQHMHLIKTKGKPLKVLFYTKKPYIRISR